MTDPAAADLGDLPIEEFERLATEVAGWMARYLEGVGDHPVLAQVEPGSIRAALPSAPPAVGEPMDAALQDFRDLIMPGITHWNHPGFMGYFAITGSAPGILGEMLAAVLNVNAMVWRSSPAGTELEEVTADWLRQLLGLPDRFDGVINDTASSSSLYALAAAREIAFPDAHQSGMFGVGPGRVYASDQAHSSVEKAVLTLGLGQDGFATVPSDDVHQMRVDALREMLQRDAEAGVKPVAIVATVGTTSSASVDPVAEIADVAREVGCWLHVDAAYGGPAAIVPELRPLFAGWEHADSIVVNPHKWLFTPVDCSLLYCAKPDALVRAFSIIPEYLSSKGQGETRDLMDYGVSLGRRFRSLKLWFVLRAFGREGIVARLRNHVAMAHEFEVTVDSTPGWEVVAPVHFSTVAFRYAPPGLSDAAADDANRRILDHVNGSGEIFLIHTSLSGRIALRLSIGHLNTTREHVARAWELLQEGAGLAEAGDA